MLHLNGENQWLWPSCTYLWSALCPRNLCRAVSVPLVGPCDNSSQCCRDWKYWFLDRGWVPSSDDAFFFKEKINKYLHFSWISDYFHSNLCLRYTLVLVTCAVHVRLEPEGSCWPVFINLVWTRSLSNVHLCHLHVIWGCRMALQCSCRNPRVSSGTWGYILDTDPWFPTLETQPIYRNVQSKLVWSLCFCVTRVW